jgi:hypothetical protein
MMVDMSRRRRCTIRFGLIVVAGLLVSSARALAQQSETVSISFPLGVTFNVTNISATTTGSPNPTAVQFSSPNLLGNHVLRISVRADAADFTPPSGAIKIPASRVSWTTSNASHGIASNGTLSSASYALVFVGQKNQAGGVDLAWTLAPPPSGIRAGAHTLTIRWKVESVAP